MSVGGGHEKVLEKATWTFWSPGELLPGAEWAQGLRGAGRAADLPCWTTVHPGRAEGGIDVFCVEFVAAVKSER